jgi:hypothetical protein
MELTTSPRSNGGFLYFKRTLMARAESKMIMGYLPADRLCWCLRTAARRTTALDTALGKAQIVPLQQLDLFLVQLKLLLQMLALQHMEPLAARPQPILVQDVHA